MSTYLTMVHERIEDNPYRLSSSAGKNNCHLKDDSWDELVFTWEWRGTDKYFEKDELFLHFFEWENNQMYDANNNLII